MLSGGRRTSGRHRAGAPGSGERETGRPPSTIPRSPEPPPPMSSYRPKKDALLGTVVGGQYRVDAKIGEGGMGSVYRATQLAMDRQVALKVLRAQVPAEDKPQLIERFRREAHATSKLRHPNTVSVYDFGETPEGVLYMVLELLEGATLSQVITEQAPLAPERVASMGRQIAKSLAEAHALGIVHRDLKPDNVFVCDYHGDPDFAKVMDFGIARLLTGEDERQVTRTGMMVGTPRYIAPEQAMARQVSPAADLYALGVILFEMLTGRTPYAADSAMGLALAHIHEPIPELELPGVPEALAASWRGLVTALLTKNPKRRPQDAGEVAQWLGQLELDSKRVRAKGAWKVEATDPGRESPSTYEGPSAKSTVTVSRAFGGARGNLWIGLAAAALMILGGVTAYLLIGIEEGAPRSEVVALATTAPRVAVADVTEAPTPAAAPTAEATQDDAAEGDGAAEASPERRPTRVIDLGLPLEPLEPGPTRLVLQSEPTGAAVRRGSRLVCVTPCDVNIDPEVGMVELSLRARGYQEHALFVELLAGETITETVTLRRRGAVRPATTEAPGGSEAREPDEPERTTPGLPALRLDGP